MCPPSHTAAHAHLRCASSIKLQRKPIRAVLGASKVPLRIFRNHSNLSRGRSQPHFPSWPLSIVEAPIFLQNSQHRAPVPTVNRQHTVRRAYNVSPTGTSYVPCQGPSTLFCLEWCDIKLCVLHSIPLLTSVHHALSTDQ